MQIKPEILRNFFKVFRAADWTVESKRGHFLVSKDRVQFTIPFNANFPTIKVCGQSGFYAPRRYPKFLDDTPESCLDRVWKLAKRIDATSLPPVHKHKLKPRKFSSSTTKESSGIVTSSSRIKTCRVDRIASISNGVLGDAAYPDSKPWFIVEIKFFTMTEYTIATDGSLYYYVGGKNKIMNTPPSWNILNAHDQSLIIKAIKAYCDVDMSNN